MTVSNIHVLGAQILGKIIEIVPKIYLRHLKTEIPHWNGCKQLECIVNNTMKFSQVGLYTYV